MSKGSACCFFGHHDAPDKIKDALRRQVKNLILNENIRRFYVGNHGHFDYMALEVLREMKTEFPDIDYAVVLAYLPENSEKWQDNFTPRETLFPDGLESVPKRYRIPRRNKWMLDNSDIILCFVRHYFGGSGKTTDKALKQGKRIINLAES